MIGLGSNLGEKLENIARAVKALRAVKGVRVKAVSSLYRTEPVGRLRQPWFYNAAAKITTTLSPAVLLKRMKRMEKSLGRRRGRKGGPRVIDLDLLLYGRRIVKNRGVIVPHPRMHQRAFVLGPCAEIAGRMVHPAAGVTIRRMSAGNRGKGRIQRLGRTEQAAFRKGAALKGRDS